MNSIQSSAVRFLLRRSNIWGKPLDETRKRMAGIKTNGIPDGINIADEEVGDVKCKAFTGGGKKDNAVLYFHGGGFCLGIYPSNCGFAAGISKLAETDVYMPDYRLAPENPFPAALEDAVAFYKGMLKKGYSAGNLIVMGDSSGCALAMSALLVLRQSGVPMPAALVFITPVFDLAGRGKSFLTRAGKDPFRLKDPLGIARKYFGTNNPFSPVISPLYGEFDGLPPVLIHAADCDVFLSDSVRFKEKAEAYKVKTELKVWKKMWHIFHMQAPFVPESAKALGELCEYIKSVFE